jgi:hypothetical protein
MDGGGFFHELGLESLDDLIALVYDLAYFWKVDPEQMMARPLDIFLESLAQAQRINRTLQVD